MPKGYSRKQPVHRHGRYPERGERTPDTKTTRACEWCGQQYPRVQYGRRRVCSHDCRLARNREAVLQAKYGISVADYNRMWNAQEGRCALCQRRSRLTLAVEHSHITGTIRGLMCMTCNRDILGPLDGDVERFNKAIQFLEKARDDLAQFLASTTTEAVLEPTEAPRTVRVS